MGEVWPTVTELCLQLTAGSKPVKGDEHRALGSQGCERARCCWLWVLYRALSHCRPCGDTTPGCPFTFKKYTGRSHPFGKNVTYGSINNTPEKCKHWCLVRAYCRAVDFAVSTATCYFLREINSALLVAAPTVNHYEKTHCARQYWYLCTLVLSLYRSSFFQ